MNNKFPGGYKQNTDDFTQNTSIFLQYSALIYSTARGTPQTSLYKVHSQATSSPSPCFTVLWRHSGNIPYPGCLHTNITNLENGGITTESLKIRDSHFS